MSEWGYTFEKVVKDKIFWAQHKTGVVELSEQHFMLTMARMADRLLTVSGSKLSPKLTLAFNTLAHLND